MIRQRTPWQDDESIYRLVVEELVPYSTREFSPDELSPGTISRRLDRNTTYVLASPGRRPFGFVSFLAKDRSLFIDMIALDRKYQRHGWGSMLLQAAERYGRERRCRESMLYVDEGNWGAQRFYLRHGYRVVEYLSLIQCFRLAKML